MITKQDVIDYVMHTVWNPNPAVLKSLLDQLSESENPISDEDFIEVTISCNYNVEQNSTIYNLIYCGKSNDEFGIFEVNNKSLTGETGFSSTKINVYCPSGKHAFINLNTEVLNQLQILSSENYIVLQDLSGETQGVAFQRSGDTLTVSMNCSPRNTEE